MRSVLQSEDACEAYEVKKMLADIDKVVRCKKHKEFVGNCKECWNDYVRWASKFTAKIEV